MSPPIPFAGLAPDARVIRGAGEISGFDPTHAIDMGRELARAVAGVTTRDVAEKAADLLNAFEHDRRPALVLVRALFCARLDALPAERRAEIRGASVPEDEGFFLWSLATRGLHDATAESAGGERASPLSSGAPLVQSLARRLLGDEPAATGTFLVADVAASRDVPSEPFLSAYGVRSVFGVGAAVWPGAALVIVAFSRAPVDASILPALSTLALYMRLACTDTVEAARAIDAGARERLRATVLDELVRSHEVSYREAQVEWRRRLDAAVLAATRAADESAKLTVAHNGALRRAQRAMLNVIEDLREAREALSSKVEERTRQLALTNARLEARNRDLEEFVYIASHDLQEPLRTVGGYLQMVQRRYGRALGAEADAFVRYAIEGAQRMQALIESLLVYSRTATKEAAFELLALDAPLDAALQNLALRIEETGASISRSPLPRVRADRIQMIQLFQNLLSNALKFAGDAPPRVHVSGAVEASTCTLEVRDEGIGFNPKYVDRIFKIFRRLRRDTTGTGIGLAVCKKIVERHGGEIEARSAPGAGATFIVRLPERPPTEGAT